MTSGPRLRPEMDAIPAYAASRPVGAAAPDPAQSPAHLLAANENPYEPLPGVLQAAIAAAGRFNRYPDMGCGRLVEAVARHLDVPASWIATGTGSVGVAQSLVQAVAGPGDEVLYAWRSFEAYPIITTVCGATRVEVPLTDDARHDLAAMARRIGPRTRLVFLCTPNNPTGTAIGGAELAEFLRRVPDDVLVVVDEAYVEFVRHQDGDEDPVDGIALCRAHPNVAVLRTFSKAYGLAGLRVGFTVASEPVAAAARKTAVPYGVSHIAQEAAIASLDAADELAKRVETLVAERRRVEQALSDLGQKALPSQANFVWLPLREQSAAFGKYCAEAGIAVRAFAEEGVRVTIGAPESNDRFLEVAASALRDG